MPKINSGGVDKSVHEEITEITFDHEGAHLAVVHALQQPANGCPDALIFKSEESDEELTKALEQITVTMSMEEYLRKFMNMYYSDAEMLTMMMGMTTEYEYYQEHESEPMTHMEYLQMKMDKIQILEDNMMDIERSTYSDLDEDIREAAKQSLTQLFKGFATDTSHQEQFEQHVVEKAEHSSLSTSVSSDAVTAEENTEETVQSSSSTEVEKTSSNGNSKESTNMPKTTETTPASLEDLLKSADLQELIKAQVEAGVAEAKTTLEKEAAEKQEALDKATTRIADLEKAEQERIEKSYSTFADTLGFLGEDEEKEEIVKAIMTVRSTDTEAAATMITALTKAKEALDASVSTEHGYEGHSMEKSSTADLDAMIEQLNEKHNA